MDANGAFLLMAWYTRRRRRRTVRRYWEHPIVRERLLLGTFKTLMGQLRQHPEIFFNYFRMSMATFDDLLRRVENDLRRQDTTMRISISPEERLAICLRYFASGCSFKDLHYSYRTGVSTISKIVSKVSHSIWNELSKEFIALPKTADEWLQIASGFEQKANFPHCIGAVDGKHIRVKKPANSGSLYFNYKDYFSIVLMAIVDSDYRFIYVNVGSYGKDCDSSIFKETALWKKMVQGTLNLPRPKPLTAESLIDLPYVLIGDEGFGLHENLLRPFGGTHLENKKKIFNYRLTRARRYVECNFGIFSNKWRIFHRPLDVKEDTAIWVVKACTVLHNFVKEKEWLHFEETMPLVGLDNLDNTQTRRGGRSADSIRTAFSDYFQTPTGSVPWQNEAIGE